MKFRKMMLCLSLMLALVLGLNCISYADDTQEDYTYTVRVFSGAKGSIGGADHVEATVSYGEMFSFNIGSVVVEDDRYYVKGIRLSGRDNNTAMAGLSFRVTADADYVVVYGIKGDAVAYTVRFVDQTGKELAPQQTYYGNVGDKPVAAYAYVEGYVPQAYNLTRTLTMNPAANVFTFIYTKTSQSTGGSTGTLGGSSTGGSTGTAAGGNTGGSTAGGNTGGSTAGGNTGSSTTGGNTGSSTGNTGGSTGNSDDAAGETAESDDGNSAETIETEEDYIDIPQDIIDLDDEQVPLDDLNESETEEVPSPEPSRTPTGGARDFANPVKSAVVAVEVIMALALAAIVVYLILSRKRRK